MTVKNQYTPDATSGYQFWTPPADRYVRVGPEQRPVPLPSVPLPIHREDAKDGEPNDQAIGLGVYDYLRQFPDCSYKVAYAELLRDAFPHFLADLAAQIAMLEHKEVDAHFVRRKVAGLKILGLLQPENPGLQQQLGIAIYNLGLTFTELPECQAHLLAAMGFLQRARSLRALDPVTLNYLGQIDFFLGDYPGAARCWRQVLEQLEEGPAREAFAAKIRRIDDSEVPDHPLVDDLEAIGDAMQAYAAGDYGQARLILEKLEEEGSVLAEFPSPEFFYLLGMSRGKVGDSAGAFEAFEKALELAPDFGPAIEGKDLVLEGKEF